MTAMLTPSSSPPQRYRWTVEQFHRVGDAGLLEGIPVILIDGELIEMPAAKPPHDISLALADYLFKRIFSLGYVVRIQMGLVFSINTDPIPDIAVVPGDPRTMTTTPTTAELVVEVSDSSLSFDTNEKASLYAAAGILDYWAIDVIGKRVFVFRDPQADPSAAYGHTYKNIASLVAGQSIAPLAAPGFPINAGELLP